MGTFLKSSLEIFDTATMQLSMEKKLDQSIQVNIFV